MAHIFDQGVESEFTLADAGHITVAITHGQPDEEETPTNEQLSALNVRVIVQLGSPYVDFAVFAPYARKTTRAHRFTAYLPQPHGSWLAKEIPGPTNYQAWLYCWRVFRVACLMLKVAHEMPLERKIEKLATQWPTAWHLVGLAEDKCRVEHFNRLKSRIEFDISLGRAAPPMWDSDSPWSAIFLKTAEDDETYWDDNIRHPCHELVGTRWQRRSQSLRASGCGGGACRRYGGARPRNVSSSRRRELLGSWHFDQGHGTPRSRGRGLRRPQSMCREKLGLHLHRSQRTKATEREDRTKERASQSIKTVTVVFYLEFRWWDMWRAFTRKPMSGGQNSQMHYVSVRQPHGEGMATDLTRSRNERNWHSGKGLSTLVGTWRRMFHFLALFSWFSEIRAGRGHLGSRSSARYQGQSHQPRYPPRWHRFACGRALSLRISRPR